jgi:hypothetical protein
MTAALSGTGRWRAICDSHQWEGAAQDDRADASQDLAAHEATFPDEDHRGARVEREAPLGLLSNQQDKQ